MEKEFYSVEEFAEIFQVGYLLILKAIKQGRVRAFKITTGSRSPYRIHKSEVLRVQFDGIHEINEKMSKHVEEIID
jgi:excisionase family DNA binding protein